MNTAEIHSSHRMGRAFSLIELLVVLGVIVFIVAVMWGRNSRSFQLKAMSLCEGHLQNIHIALKTYAVDHNGLFPIMTNATTSEPVLSLLIPQYTTGSENFICPGSKDSPIPAGKPFAELKISYAFYMGRTSSEGADAPLLSDRQVNSLAKNTGSSLFSTTGKGPGSNHDRYGGNVLFCDGSVQRSESTSSLALPTGTNITLLDAKP